MHFRNLYRLTTLSAAVLLLAGCPQERRADPSAGPKPTGEYDLPAPPEAAPAPKPTKPTAAAAPSAGEALYKVVDGNKVDANTLNGFRAWRSAACDRCHGANQEGLVGPSLIDGLKRLTQEEFKTTVLNGRLEKGMPSFRDAPAIATQIDALYAYLKGRSDGAITQAKVEPIP